MTEFIYTGTNDADLVRFARKNKRPDKALLLTATVYEKKRTLDQNKQAFVWYAQIAKTLDYETVQGWQNHCKLNFGIPILRGDDPDFENFYHLALGHLTHEQQLKAMDFIPVTRLMKTKQFNRYFEALQNEFAKQGVMLTFLNEPEFA
jgi:hypothetical protein